MGVFVVGQIQIKNQEKWDEYKSLVQATLKPYGGIVKLRGTQVKTLIGDTLYPDIVVIEFESHEKAEKWYFSSEYQNIVPIREKGADIILNIYT
ncbi:MAG: DUF1330 domain-containing protein [Sulfuricurvum sp.]|nr:DUF1330 domain-containing protein [Sulfuricurvum sp.]